MFLTNEDAIILMSYNPTMEFFGLPIRTLGLDDRKRLYDVGVRTANEFLMWRAVEPQKGRYDWSSLEAIINVNRAAGLKTMFSVCQYWYPSWMPADWFCVHQGGGHAREIPSFWNKEAMDYVKRYYEYLSDFYAADDVQFILSEYLTGESIMHNTPCWYDPYAVASFRDYVGDSKRTPGDINDPDTKSWLFKTVYTWMRERQAILGLWHKEIYDSHQWLISLQSPANMNWAMPEILKMIHNEFPEYQQMMIQYTYFAHLTPDGGEYKQWIDNIVDTTGAKIIVEAQYCEGLEQTTPLAIKHNRFGQIVCPLHPFTKHDKLEQWMVDAIAKSNQLWMESRKENKNE